MLNKFYKIAGGLTILFLPTLVLAAEALGNTKILLRNAKRIVTEILIPLVFTLALLFFFYGVVKYIWSSGQGKDEGKKFMIWGVVAMFVIASVWGLVAFVQNEILGGPGPSNMPIPTIGGGGPYSI